MMKKIIISTMLIALCTITSAQPRYEGHREHNNGPKYHQHDRREQRENRSEVRELEKDAIAQKTQIDNAARMRSINPSQYSRLKVSYNKIWDSIERAKQDRLISDREIRVIKDNLIRNDRELDNAMRKTHRRH